jgi:AAA+ superfamily predicted ATPase
MSEETELRERLEHTEYEIRGTRGASDPGERSRPQPSPPSLPRTDIDFAQWQVLPNGVFRPGARTADVLPSGAYRVDQDQYGPYLALVSIRSDDIIELPEASHMRVLSGIRKFWQKRENYKKHGLLYKRGVLLWGPPGGGKTVTAQLLVTEITTRHNGIVIIAENPDLMVAALRFLRSIEPSRPLIVLMEDVDEIIGRFGEHAILAILDGEHQTDNVVYVATTNYPERLGARIVNRPSRFDERIKIGMPTAASRLAYLRKTCGDYSVDFDVWVRDTEGLSVAHLRELVVAVMCLEQEYADVIERLRAMEIQPKPEEGFRRKETGFANNAVLNQSLRVYANGKA